MDTPIDTPLPVREVRMRIRVRVRRRRQILPQYLVPEFSGVRYPDSDACLLVVFLLLAVSFPPLLLLVGPSLPIPMGPFVHFPPVP